MWSPPYHVAKRILGGILDVGRRRMFGEKLDVGRRKDHFFWSSPNVWGKIERRGPGR